MAEPRCAVIVPAFNEEVNLGAVLAELARERPHTPVVVINDGSRDRTAQVAAQGGAAVVSHLINLGYARAVQTGIRWAVEEGYDYCLSMDADGQHHATVGREEMSGVRHV